MSKRRRDLDVPLHKHCVVCDKPIPFDSETNLCSKECAERYNQHKAAQRRLDKVKALIPTVMIVMVFIWWILLKPS